MGKIKKTLNNFHGASKHALLEKIILSISIVLMILFLGFFIKGRIINNQIYYQTQYTADTGGPYEASISAARYALTKAIVDDSSLFLNPQLAKLASPDVVYFNGKFTSIFTPAISFFGVPFYIVGQWFHLPQIFTYLSTVLIALINVLLIMILARKLGAHYLTGFLAGAIFLFATNALPYALTYTQHHFTVMLILLALINSIGERTTVKNIIFGALFGIGALVDIPNIFILAPIGLYILYKEFQKNTDKDKTILSLKLNIFGLLVGLIPFLFLFGWYNYATNGSVLKVAQFIGKSDYFVDKQQIPAINQSPKPQSGDYDTPPPVGIQHLPFETRNQLYDFYIFFLSDERSWIYYSPVVFIGILGIWESYRKRNRQIRVLTLLAVAVALTDVAVYTMFGDPWGGWNFGPRYLIPAAAVLCLFISIAIEKYKKNIFFIVPFFILTVYSVWVTFMGALTSNSIPPKVEAVALQNPIPYTYAFNELLISRNFSSSLFYNLFLSHTVSAAEYLYLLMAGILIIFVILYILIFLRSKEEPVYE